MTDILRHVPFMDISMPQIRALARSLQAAPEDVRPATDMMVDRLAAETALMFSIPGGFIIVGKRDNRLTLDALCCEDLRKVMIHLVDNLLRLAAEWECDMIETIVFDPRIACVIQKLGASVESTTLTLAVER